MKIVTINDLTVESSYSLTKVVATQRGKTMSVSVPKWFT